MIGLSSKKTVMRFETRERNAPAGGANCAISVFLRPKSVLNIFRRLPFMVGRVLERPRFAASQASILSHRHEFETSTGGLSIRNGANRMVNQIPKPAQTSPETNKKPLTDPEAIQEIQGLMFCIVQCCRFVENQINQTPYLRRTTVEMLRDDAARLVNVCESALQGGSK